MRVSVLVSVHGEEICRSCERQFAANFSGEISRALTSAATPFLAPGHPRHLLRRLPGTTPPPARRLRGPHLHCPAVQLQPQLRNLLAGNEREAAIRRPP